MPKTRRKRVIADKRKIVAENEGYHPGMCLAKLKQESSDGHTYCRRIANKYTLRCKLHGGRTRKTEDRTVTGRYARAFDGKLGEVYEELKNDPKLLDLTDELAALRTMMVVLKKTAFELGRKDIKQESLSLRLTYVKQVQTA